MNIARPDGLYVIGIAIRHCDRGIRGGKNSNAALCSKRIRLTRGHGRGKAGKTRETKEQEKSVQSL